MPALSELQRQFSDYLFSRTDDISTYVIDDGKLNKKIRSDIYKNAYIIRLKKCIETDHPMLCKYLGDDLFEKMANGYINSYPSHFTLSPIQGLVCICSYGDVKCPPNQQGDSFETC